MSVKLVLFKSFCLCRYMLSSVRSSVVCLSVVCNVGAPYSDDWNFRQCFTPLICGTSIDFEVKFYGDRPRGTPQLGC